MISNRVLLNVGGMAKIDVVANGRVAPLLKADTTARLAGSLLENLTHSIELLGDCKASACGECM